MQAVVSGRDTLAVLPSGAGKTAIYQVAGQLLDGPVVVVSPLIALQRDQVERLAEIEEHAGRAAQAELDHVRRRPAGGPRGAAGTERSASSSSRPSSSPSPRSSTPSARPGRRCSSSTRRTASRPGATTSAPTTCGWAASSSSSATRPSWPSPRPPPRRCGPRSSSAWRCATPEIVVAGFDRPEIRLEVDHYADAYGKEQGVLDRVLAEIGEGRGPGIVYSATRKGTEEIAEQLTDRGLRARPYHAGLNKADREDTQRAFMDDELDVVVATTAFGMGIDKPDTRFVIHAEPADSVDSYYQEIGRAGRDGEPALAVLVYRQEDLGLRRFFAAGTPAEEELQQVAGLVAAAAAAGIEEGVDVKDLREETGRARHPAGPRPEPARAGLRRRPGRGRRRPPRRQRAAARRGGRGRPRARRAPRAGRPEPRRDDARLRRDHRLPAAVPARLLRRAARRALRQLRQLLRRQSAQEQAVADAASPRSRWRHRSSTASGAPGSSCGSRTTASSSCSTRSATRPWRSPPSPRTTCSRDPRLTTADANRPRTIGSAIELPAREPDGRRDPNATERASPADGCVDRLRATR